MEQFREFIEQAGGAQKVAAACGVKRDTVYKWQERNRIPAGYIFDLKRLAESEKIDLPLDVIESWTREAA